MTRVAHKRRMLMSASLLVGGLATEAPAQFKTWIGGAGVGTWANAGSWSPSGVPTATDIAFLTQSDASNRTVVYNNLPGPLNSAALIFLNAAGVGEMTLLQIGGRLNVPTLTLATSGHGVFSHINSGSANIGALSVANLSAGRGTVEVNGGVLSITNNFTLGNLGAGTCLIEAGALTAGQLIIGNNGSGTFLHAPVGVFTPAVTANVIRLGVGSQSSGAYLMSSFGSGLAVNAGTIQVGINGSGVFSQIGRVSCANDLILGDGATGAGRYDLVIDTLTVGGDLIIGGRGGDGTFNHSADLDVANAVRVGNGGRYNLDSGRLNAGSVLLSPGGVFDGSSGACDADSFLHSGGTVTGTLIVERFSTLQPPANYIHNSGTFSGRLELKRNSMLTLTADFTAPGGLGVASGSFALPAGRTLNLGASSFSINAATVSVDSNVNAGSLFMFKSGAVTPLPFLDQRGTSQANLGIGTVNTGTYLLSGAGALLSLTQLSVGNTFAGTLGVGHVIVSAGSLSITGPTAIQTQGDFVQTAGAATFAAVLNNGTIQLSGGVTSVNNLDGTGAAIVSGNGSLTANRIRQSQLTITGAGPRVRIRANGTDAATSRVGAIDLGTPGFAAITGVLDLTDNAFVVDYNSASQLNQITQYLASGYNSGSWNGFGITSSQADANQLGVGYAESADVFSSFPATFRGEQVDNTAVLIAYTLYGDANLDKIVDIGDFALLAANFNLPSTWSKGDFNYSGMTDIGDFALLASNFNQSLPAELPRSVPEPAAAAVLLWAMLPRRAPGVDRCSPIGKS